MPTLAGQSHPPSVSREDSLEYYIKFPTNSTTNISGGFGQIGQNPMASGTSSVATTSTSETNDYHQLHHQMASSATFEETEDSVFMYNETNNVPVVLLLGWAGCQDKYLMKYSKIYEDRG